DIFPRGRGPEGEGDSGIAEGLEQGDDTGERGDPVGAEQVAVEFLLAVAEAGDLLAVLGRGPVEDVGDAHDVAHPEGFLELLFGERLVDFGGQLEPAPLVLVVGIDDDAVEVEDDADVWVGKGTGHRREVWRGPRKGQGV